MERIRSSKLERGRIGLLEIDPRHKRLSAGQPVQRAARGPARRRTRVHQGFMHELLSMHSAGRAGLHAQGRQALRERDATRMFARAKPGVTEYELRAAAGAAILEGGGDIDFLIIGSTPMANPSHGVRQSASLRPRAARRRHHQHGTRRRLSRLHRADRLADLHRQADRHGARFWDEITLPGYETHRGRDQARQAGREHAHRRQILPPEGRAVAARSNATASTSSPTGRM